MSKRPQSTRFEAVEDRFGGLFHNMTEGCALHEILTDDEGRAVDFRFIELNPAFERLTGLRREVVLGKRVTEVLSGIEPFWIETYGRVALTGEPTSFAHYYPAPLDRWYQVYAYRPAPRQFVAIFMDITEKQGAEIALKQSESLLHTVIETIPDGIYAKDAQSRLVLLNPAGLKIVGKSADQILGKNDREIYDDPAVGAAIVENDRRVMASGIPETFEEELLTPEGYRCFLDTKAPWRDAAGNVIGIVGVSRDITEQKRTEQALLRNEERLKLAQASAGAGIWDWDIPAGTLEWSEEFFHLFGLDPRRQEATFDVWRSAIHPDDRALAEQRISAAVANRVALASEYRIVLPSGEVKWVHALGNTVYGGDGEPLRMSGICFDATERKKAEALREALAEQESLRLGAAVEQASEAVVMLDLDGTIRYVNAAFESINKVPRDQAKGRSYLDGFAPGSSAVAVREILAGAIPGTDTSRGKPPTEGTLSSKWRFPESRTRRERSSGG